MYGLFYSKSTTFDEFHGDPLLFEFLAVTSRLPTCLRASALLELLELLVQCTPGGARRLFEPLL